MCKKYIDEEGGVHYASTKGENTKFAKKMKLVGEEQVKQPDRRISIESGQTVTPCNDINKFTGNIDYDYYIDEARKLLL